MSEKKKVRIPLTRYEWPDERLARIAKQKKILLTISIIFLIFSLGFFSHDFLNPTQNSVVVSESDQSQFDRLKAVYDVLISDWYFGKDQSDLDQKLINQAILGMVESTEDPHTVYMTKEEVEQFAQAIDRGFVGIGVSYFDSNGTYVVEKVFIDSPAHQAGVKAGDIISKVDGTDVYNIGSDVLVEMVRGEENSIVSIEFIRGDEIVVLDITRAPINNTAFGEMLDEDTAFLEIYQFGSSTALEVETYLKSFKEKGATNILIDLRDNGGGYLNALEDIGSLFLEKDTILIQQDTTEGERLVSRSSGNVVMEFLEIVILINENTASAAEVFTAALTENIEATVVGVTSYGKGTVQQQYPFSDGSSLKYTVAEWLTPLGNHIHEVGITPDIIVNQHPIMSRAFSDLSEDEAYELDQVHSSIQDAQLSLDFLGYSVSRTDGYYDLSTQDAIIHFQTSLNSDPNGLVSKELLDALLSEVVRVWHLDNADKDTQMIEALKLLNE